MFFPFLRNYGFIKKNNLTPWSNKLNILISTGNENVGLVGTNKKIAKN